MNRQTTNSVSLEDAGYNFSWDTKKLWKLQDPVIEENISELIWHFDIRFLWEGEVGTFEQTPAEVLRKLENYPKQRKRLSTADLSDPIIVIESNSKLLILDGLHRLMKAHKLGLQKIRTIKLSANKAREIITK